jgi:triosephosphate isomerase (TIM)
VKYIVANWKMNMSLEDCAHWIDGFALTRTKNTDIIIAPSLLYLAMFKELVPADKFSLAAQDVSEKDKGAHTGDNGAFQLADLVKYCIVGHSERHEPRDIVEQKAKQCLQNKITPIICFVTFEDIQNYDLKNCIVAWEDPSNISVNGQYREKNPEEIVNGVTGLKKNLPTATPLLYGGSVNRQNIGLLAKIDKLDGVLVGNASLDPQHFAAIVQAYL